MRRIAAWSIGDWLPLPVIFATYQAAGWTSGLLGRPLCDQALLQWDRRLFGAAPGVWLTGHLPGAALPVFEAFYLSYYLFVPLAPLLLYARWGSAALWRLWTCVGLSFLICDLLFPWFPSTPPRLLGPEFSYGGPLQAFNLWILDRFSIHGNVFPSSHVAATTTLALCHLRYRRGLGFFFVLWALGVAISTVSGGYHYGVDAAGGLAVGVAAERLGGRLFRRAVAPMIP